jgi:hypothetical protein
VDKVSRGASIQERYLARVIKRDGCWDWSAATTKAGYGLFNAKRKTYYAHRVSYEMHCGEVPEGLHVLHECDNPRCSNPEHLFVGTPADNMRDRGQKGRAAAGERHGQSKLSADQVAKIRSTAGVTNLELAHVYNMSPGQISLIRSGKRWRHVQ